jgi:ubiquinone/menaquinone biosynthesis C-methylase UbiE
VAAALPTRGDVARTFDEIAGEFDRTRRTAWPEVVEFAKALPPGRRVADLGCGNGRHANLLVDAGHRVVGLDASVRLLEIARRRVPQASFVRGDVCALPFRDETFSAAIAVASLHHLPSEGERLQALREVSRVLEPGAEFLVTVWALERETSTSLRETRPAGPGPGDVWVPWRAGGREAMRFYHLFAEGELTRLVRAAGLRLGKYFRSGDNYVAVAERHG